MFDATIDLLGDFLYLVVLVLVIGFLSLKWFLWGSLISGVLWVIYFLLPSFSASTVADMMVPRLLAIWTIYPRALNGVLGQAEAAFGDIGAVITFCLFAVLLVPYAIGVIAGLYFWPVIRILGVIL